ncbi:Arc-like DNA binding domain-containing protein [Rhizobium sp. RU35A]|uniref:Arc family DNA-binding protein n=1 Tax=Rhizobium sp. RU35A TaxID=1907414 RepID=UPI000953D6A9|nr:Arc family DNA-binding protein [Rhizobium sp. RU35A]SIR06488.1 Arc-like DNA binding domain-containing protein [Rhizobium sp. RU35A]
MHQISAQRHTLGFFTISVSNMTMAKQDDYSRYTIRVPRDVYAAIENSAEAANRSVNAEITARLEFSIANPPSTVEGLRRRIEALESEIGLMEQDLKDQASEMESLREIISNAKYFLDKNRDYQRRLMFHVLNYIDEIPEDLAIWAHDVAMADKKDDILREQILQGKISGQDSIRKIREKRQTFIKRQIEIIRESLSDNGDSGDS